MARKAQKEAAIENLRAKKQASLRLHGNSMHPRIPSGSRVTLDPCTAEEAEVGDAVLCRVNGNIMCHLVKAKQGDRCQISNLKGRVNGWTKAVYGRVVKVEN